MTDSTSMASDDISRVALPGVLMAGTLALFALPSIEGEARFHEARIILEAMGASWLLGLAWIGVGAAVVAAIFLRPDGPHHRPLLITAGPLLGLAIPLAFWLHLYDTREYSREPFISWIGHGPMLFSASCVIASIVGFGKYVVPALLGLGLAAFAILPGSSGWYGGDPSLSERLAGWAKWISQGPGLGYGG